MVYCQGRRNTGHRSLRLSGNPHLDESFELSIIWHGLAGGVMARPMAVIGAVSLGGPYVATVMTMGRRDAGVPPPASVSSALADRELAGAERLRQVAVSQASEWTMVEMRTLSISRRTGRKRR